MAISKPTAPVVIAITGTKLSAEAVESIIDDAALMGESCLTDKSEAVQVAAVKWLAAHLIASTPVGGAGMLTSRRLGDASKSYAVGQLSGGINGTLFGQQAVALVPCLATLGQPTAKIEVI